MVKKVNKKEAIVSKKAMNATDELTNKNMMKRIAK